MHLSDAKVVLFGAGFVVPENISRCTETRYFSSIRYLARTSTEDLIRKRLISQPEWRNAHKEEYIKDHINFNNWIRTNDKRSGGDRYSVLDTLYQTIDESSVNVMNWITENVM